VQVAPANGASFNVYPRETTFVWQPVEGATRYVLEVDCYHCCRANAWCYDVRGTAWWQETGLTNTSFTLFWVGAQPGRWRVWAEDRKTAGLMSGWWTFQYLR
jgi:hypothetical protein